MQLKYGNAGKFLGISLYKKDNHIYIEVEDHGAGILKKTRYIFLQGHIQQTERKATGIRLSYFTRTCKFYGRFLSVVSIPQEKTVFTILIVKLEKS